VGADMKYEKPSRCRFEKNVIAGALIASWGWESPAIKTRDSETKLKEYENVISKSKLEAKTIFNQAREKTLKDINTKKEVLDQQIDDEIIKAEEEIKTLRKSAPDKINKIAIETSSELIQKLIGAEVNNSSISAIVDDLSKRNGDKYYGN
jgi:F-type H+-transporting ATPase subunit b